MALHMGFIMLVAIKRAGVAFCWFAFKCNITTLSLLQFLVVMVKCKQQWAAVGRAQNNISRLESTCSCSISNCGSKRNRYEMTEMFLFNNRCCATLTASPAFLFVCPLPDCLCGGECSLYRYSAGCAQLCDAARGRAYGPTTHTLHLQNSRHILDTDLTQQGSPRGTRCTAVTKPQ